MKHTLFCAIAFTALTACNDAGKNTSGPVPDSSANSIATGDSSRAVPDSLIGGSGYMSSGNTASGNSNAGSLNTDTLPLGAGRNNTPDSIKAKVLKQRGDTASSVKHQ